MAIEGGGKMKVKRQNADSRPYARRPSLLGRMKNTVKDMLAPSWVIDLVNGVRKTSTKNLQGCEPLQNETDEEIPVTRALNRINSDELLQNAGPTQPHSSAAPSTSANPMPYTQPQMPYNAYRPLGPVSEHIMTNGDDQPDASDYSVATSGCSSMIPQPDRKDYQGEIIQMNDSHLRQMQMLQQQQQQQQHMEMRPIPPVHNASNVDVANSSTSSTMEGSFLWSSSKPRTSKPQPPAKSHTPSFNTSLLSEEFKILDVNSPSTSDRSVYHQSRYYPGKTTFGGAASYRKARIKPSPMPYEPSPMRKQVQARPLNNSSLGGVTSSTAKRILSTLERMSTPLSDAKKIPMDGDLSSSVLTMTPGTYRKRRTFNTSLSQSLNEGPPTSNRSLSSFASIAPNVHSFPKNTTCTQVKATDGPGPASEPSYQVGGADRGGGRSGKMKRDRGTHYSSKQNEDEEVEVPDLSTSFVLPVSNFSLPPLGDGFRLAATSAEQTPSEMRSARAPNVAAATTATSSSDFSFSSPIVKSSSTDLSTPVVNTQFHFSSPITVDNPAPKSTTSSLPTSGFTFKSSSTVPKMKPPTVNFKAPVESDSSFKPATELVSGSVMDILNKKTTAGSKSGSEMDIDDKPTPNGNIGGIQPASEMRTGSVMDILGKSCSASSSESSLGFLKAASGWTCDTCLIQNKGGASTCVACETPKSRSKPAPAPSSGSMSSGASSLGFLTAGSTNWTCDTCLIQNNVEALTCVACETPKPRDKPAPSSTPSLSSSSSSSLLPLRKMSGGDWTCDTCLIQNKPDKSKCVACETPKPQAGPAASASSSGSSSLGLLRAVSSEWTCETCLIQNKCHVSRCVACESPRTKESAVLPSQPTHPASNTQAGVKPFQFGTKKVANWECDTCLVTNAPDTNKCAACEMPRPGAQAPTGFTSTGGFSFGVGGGFSSSSSSSSAGPAASASTTGFSFGKPAVTESASTSASTSESDLKAPTGFTFGAKPVTETSEKSAAPSSGFQFATTSKPKEDEAKPAFSGTGGFKFGGQTTTARDSDEQGQSKSAAFGGFKFGGPTTNETPAQNADTGSTAVSGFQFSKPGSTEENTPTAAPNVTVQLGEASDKASSEKPAMLFQYGQAKDANANVSKPLGAGSTGGFGGFSNNAVKTDTPAANAFQFGGKPTDSNNLKEMDKDAVTPVFGVTKTNDPPKPAFGATVEKPPAPAGGFQFSSGSAAPSLPSGGFAFGANGTSSSKVEEKPTAAVPVFTFGGTSNRTEVKAAPFSFGMNTAAKPAESSSQAPSFNFKPTGPVPTTALPGKRTCDDRESGSDAKKANVSFSAPSQVSGFNSNFKFGEAKPAEGATPSSSFTFGQGNTSTAFGTNNTTNNNSTGGFAGFSASTTASSVFGAPAQRSVFGSSAPSATNAFGSAAPAPAFGAPTTTAAPSGGINLTTPASFNFGTAANTTPSSGLFQFSGNNQGNPAASDGAGANFAFGQSGASTQAPAPSAMPAAPTFNPTPSFNFTGSAGTGQAAVFTAGSSAPAAHNAVFGFNATGGAAAGTINPFNATASTGNANNPRRFKKAIRKIRK